MGQDILLFGTAIASKNSSPLACRWHRTVCSQRYSTTIVSAANSACTWRGAQGLAFANDQRSLAFPFFRSRETGHLMLRMSLTSGGRLFQMLHPLVQLSGFKHGTFAGGTLIVATRYSGSLRATVDTPISSNSACRLRLWRVPRGEACGARTLGDTHLVTAGPQPILP
jgi:hypothetical protein